MELITHIIIASTATLGLTILASEYFKQSELEQNWYIFGWAVGMVVAVITTL